MPSGAQLNRSHSPAFKLSWELLDRYYAGEVTLEEYKAIETYLAKHRDAAGVLSRVVAEIRGSALAQNSPEARDVSGMLAALHERMHPKMALKRLVQTCFGGSVQQAVAALLDVTDTDLTQEEMAQLRQAIRTATREGR